MAEKKSFIDLYKGKISSGAFVNVWVDRENEIVGIGYDNLTLTFPLEEWAEVSWILHETTKALFACKTKEEQAEVLTKLAKDMDDLRQQSEELASETVPECSPEMVEEARQVIGNEKGHAA